MKKNAIVKKYFENLNIKNFDDFDSFIEYIEKNYSSIIFQQVINNLIKSFDGLENELYRIKNTNLKLSLDFVSWSKSFYEKLFVNLLSIDFKNKVLDIGCDNGFVTCFLAYVFPESNFIGIDINPNSIKTANSLANRFKLKNIEFYNIDYKDVINKYLKSSFDTALSIKVSHEIEDKDNYCNIINNVLKKDGLLISCERLIDKYDLDEWIDILSKNEFYINRPISFISFNELEYSMDFPIIHARK